jgi:hypothetical protein
VTIIKTMLLVIKVAIEFRVVESDPPPAPLAVIHTTAEEIPPTRPSTRLAKAAASPCNVVQLPARVA